MQEQLDRGEDGNRVEDESRGPYFPYDRREPYPKRLKVNFRNLAVRAADIVQQKCSSESPSAEKNTRDVLI